MTKWQILQWSLLCTLEIMINFSLQNQYKISSYPLYHSKYETFKVVDEIMDRGFKVEIFAQI